MSEEEVLPYDRMCEALERIAASLDTLAALIASNQPLVSQQAVTVAAPQQSNFRQRVGAPAAPQGQRRPAAAPTGRKPIEVWEDGGVWFIECPFHQVQQAKVFQNDDNTTTIKCGQKFKANDGTQRFCGSSKVIDG